MFEYFQDVVYASNCLGSHCSRSSGKCIAHGDLRVYRHYSNFVLIREGKFCNFDKNFDKTKCNRGDWKTWKTSVHFLKNIPSLNPDRVNLVRVKDTPVLGML